jgi:hypothetical protein
MDFSKISFKKTVEPTPVSKKGTETNGYQPPSETNTLTVPKNALEDIPGIEQFEEDTGNPVPTPPEEVTETKKGTKRGLVVPVTNVNGEVFSYNIVTREKTYLRVGKTVLPTATKAFDVITFDEDTTKKTTRGSEVLMNIEIEGPTTAANVLTTTTADSANSTTSVLPSLTVATITDFVSDLISTTGLDAAIATLNADAVDFTTADFNGLTVVVRVNG